MAENLPAPASSPTGLKAWWAKFRSWPKTAQIAVWILVGLIGLAAIGSGQKKTPTPARSGGQVATTSSSAAPTTTTAPATSTTVKAQTTTTTGRVTTTTAAPATTTTTARLVTTTTAAPTTTTAAPTTTTATSYRAGEFCSTPGAVTYSSSGERLVCSTTATDSKYRWRQG